MRLVPLVSSAPTTTSKYRSSRGRTSKASSTVDAALRRHDPEPPALGRERARARPRSRRTAGARRGAARCARGRPRRARRRGSASSARICAIRPGPPTAAFSSSSGISRPSTVVAACRIDARIIAPESISVPSRSKRTTGYRTAPIVATGAAAIVVPRVTALAAEPAVVDGAIHFAVPHEPGLRRVWLRHELTRPRLLPFERRGARWELRLEPPAADRFEYLLQLERVSGTELVPDPANPLRVRGVFGEKSVVELPSYDAASVGRGRGDAAGHAAQAPPREPEAAERRRRSPLVGGGHGPGRAAPAADRPRRPRVRESSPTSCASSTT